MTTKGVAAADARTVRPCPRPVPSAPVFPDPNGELRELLLGILRAYEEQGEGELATPKLESYLRARYGGVGESRGRLGNLSAVRTAFRRMQTSLYAN